MQKSITYQKVYNWQLRSRYQFWRAQLSMTKHVDKGSMDFGL